LTSSGLSERRACAALASNRTSIRYQARPDDGTNVVVREELKQLAERYQRYGVRRMAAILNRKYGVNHKRVERLWRESGFTLPRRRRRRKPFTPVWERPAAAKQANEVWSLDFVHHVTEHGRKIKMLTVIDEYTRECLEIRVERQMKHREVMETLDELMAERGAPRHLRSDNGSEFIAAPLQNWLRSKGVIPVRIEPGNPWQNGFIESFNGRFRDECLNGELFYSRAEAQVIVDRWRDSYNNERPHSALGYLAPLELVAKLTARSGYNPASSNDFQGGRKTG
jgi:putative transposase